MGGSRERAGRFEVIFNRGVEMHRDIDRDRDRKPMRMFARKNCVRKSRDLCEARKCKVNIHVRVQEACKIAIHVA